MRLSTLSQSQSYEMQQLADTTESNPDARRKIKIMIEDFCVFTTIFAQLCEQRLQTAAVPMTTSHSLFCDGEENDHKIGSKIMAYEVFLGGSCNPTTWRSEIAIPTLQRLGITYYNPQVSQWRPELIAQEYEAKQTARVLLFVIDNQTRNTAGIIEAAQLAATRSDSLVLVVYPYHQDQMILGETISAQEYYDLTNGLLVLEYFMENQKIPIFESVSGALNGTSKILREAINVQDLNVEDGMRSIRIPTTRNGIDMLTLREIFRSIDANDTGSVRLGDAWIALQSYVNCNTSISELFETINKSDTYHSVIKESVCEEDLIEQRINLEQFWALANEWMQHTNYNTITSESEISSVWSILSKKASKFLRRVFVHPLSRLLDSTHFFRLDSEKRDLYIGVVGKDFMWLESSAVPLIKSMGLSLHRPCTSEYTVSTLPQELRRMMNSRLILLIMPQQSRGIAIATLGAYLIGLRAKLTLCIQLMQDECIVSGEQLTEQAIKDYNRGRMYLSDYATREGVPVFQNIAAALQHAIQLIQSSC